MNIDTLKKAAVCFSHCRDAGVPEIPYIQDVLYVLEISADQHAYTFGVRNHSTYIVNVCLAAAAVGHDVLNMEKYDEIKARKIVARAILDLCTNEDRCLFNPSVCEAMKELGHIVPAARDDLIRTCNCPSCKRRCKEEGLMDIAEAPIHP